MLDSIGGGQRKLASHLNDRVGYASHEIKMLETMTAFAPLQTVKKNVEAQSRKEAFRRSSDRTTG